MAFLEAVKKLNEIKARGLIKEYAIGGAYAVNLYDVPQGTYDLDVFIIIDAENNLLDLSNIYDHFRREGAKIEQEYIFVGDMPIQFLPNISPLHNEAVEHAITIEYQGVPARFIDIEYAILLMLTSYRPKDILRIQGLLNKANTEKVLQLIERFGNAKNPLSERYRKVLGGAQ